MHTEELRTKLPQPDRAGRHLCSDPPTRKDLMNNADSTETPEGLCLRSRANPILEKR